MFEAILSLRQNDRENELDKNEAFSKNIFERVMPEVTNKAEKLQVEQRKVHNYENF